MKPITFVALVAALACGGTLATAQPRQTGPLRAGPTMVAPAKVICGSYQRGNQVVTEYCQDGYECDMVARKCRPGPELQKKFDDERAAALKKAQQEIAKDKRLERRQEERAALGQGKGETYYIWNGDPRVMPTPRHRPGHWASQSQSLRNSARSSAARPNRPPLPQSVRTNIEALVVAAARLQTGDPARAQILTAVRSIIKEHQLPLDLEQLLGETCGPQEVNLVDGVDAERLSRTPQDISDAVRASNRCTNGATVAEEACRRYEFGLAVMDAEPQIRAVCRAQETGGAGQVSEVLSECARRRFLNAWDARMSPRPRTSTGVQVGRPCASASAEMPSSESLRERLRRAIEAMPDVLPVPQTPAPPPQALAAPAESSPTDTALPTAAQADDAFCAYIARRAVRGQLTAAAAAPIPAECREAIDAAKSCLEQRCSMADIIAEEERSPDPPMPWGLEDRRAVDRLLEAPDVAAAPTPPTVLQPKTPGATLLPPTPPSVPPPRSQEQMPSPTPPTVQRPGVPGPSQATTVPPRQGEPPGQAPQPVGPAAPTANPPQMPAPTSPTSIAPSVTMPPPRVTSPAPDVPVPTVPKR